MKIFSAVIYVLAAICLITGVNDFIGGLLNMKNLGADLTAAGFADPLTDNVLRFFAGIWIGVGILFILFLQDLTRYKPAMLALMGIVFLGGVGRVISVVQLGMPENATGSTMIYVGLFVELLLMPILAWWLIYRHDNHN